MKYVYKDNISKFVQFFTRVFNLEQDFENPENTVLRGIATLESFYTDLNLPTRLSDIDFDENRIEEMVEKASFKGTRTLGSFKVLGKEDFYKIYNLAL